MPLQTTKPAPQWIKPVLIIAGIYNIAFGVFAVFAPNLAFELFGMDTPLYPQLWQCIGMIVGVYGIGYIIAAFNSARHWPIVLVGMLGKIFGPIGFGWSMMTSDVLPLEFGIMLIFNDLIWWVPFTMILYDAMYRNQDASPETISPKEALERAFTNQGDCLMSMSHERPVMLVFLRHTGCTFCRQALDDLAQARQVIDQAGTDIALVHMSNPEEMDHWLKHYNIEDMPHISDPRCTFYEALGLGRATVFQAFGPSVWLPGIRAFMAGHGVGSLSGDGFRMPGVFIVDKGEITDEFKPRHVAERADFIKMTPGQLALKSIQESQNRSASDPSASINPATT